MTDPHDRSAIPTAGATPPVSHHSVLPVDDGPPARSKVSAGLAALACAACCLLPLLITAGVLTGAGAAIAERTLLATSGLLLAAAAMMWWSHRRARARTAATAGNSGCADGTCRC